MIEAKQVLLRITFIAAEQLVAAVTGEQPLDAVLAGEARAVVGRNRRGVTEGLVVTCGDLRQRIDHVLRGHVVLVVLAAEMARGNACVLHLVVARDVEADREGAGRALAQAGECAADGRTVGTAGQKGAGGRALRCLQHGGADQRAKLLLELGQA